MTAELIGLGIITIIASGIMSIGIYKYKVDDLIEDVNKVTDDIRDLRDVKQN